MHADPDRDIVSNRAGPSESCRSGAVTDARVIRVTRSGASAALASPQDHSPLRSSAVSLIPFFSPSVLTTCLVAGIVRLLRGETQMPVSTFGVSSSGLSVPTQRQAVEDHRRRILDPDLVDQLALLRVVAPLITCARTRRFSTPSASPSANRVASNFSCPCVERQIELAERNPVRRRRVAARAPAPTLRSPFSFTRQAIAGPSGRAESSSDTCGNQTQNVLALQAPCSARPPSPGSLHPTPRPRTRAARSHPSGSVSRRSTKSFASVSS